MKQLAIFLALIWGALWASYLQFTRAGHYLAVRRTWITVVIGVGIDLIICLLVIPLEQWFYVFMIILASSIGIIARSLYNEHQDEHAQIAMLSEEINHDKHS